MVQNYTPVMWDDKAFAFVPYEAFSDLPHYPKEKCEQICKELNSLIRLCTYRPKKEDIYFHPVSYVRRSGGFIVTDNQASFEKCPYPACADRHSCQKICDLMNRIIEEFLLYKIPWNIQTPNAEYHKLNIYVGYLKKNGKKRPEILESETPAIFTTNKRFQSKKTD